MPRVTRKVGLKCPCSCGKTGKNQARGDDGRFYASVTCMKKFTNVKLELVGKYACACGCKKQATIKWLGINGLKYASKTCMLKAGTELAPVTGKSECACRCGKRASNIWRGTNGLLYASSACLAKANIKRMLTGAQACPCKCGRIVQCAARGSDGRCYATLDCIAKQTDVKRVVTGATACACECGRLAQSAARGSDGRFYATRECIAKQTGVTRELSGKVACACGCKNVGVSTCRGSDGSYYAKLECIAKQKNVTLELSDAYLCACGCRKRVRYTCRGTNNLLYANNDCLKNAGVERALTTLERARAIVAGDSGASATERAASAVVVAAAAAKAIFGGLSSWLDVSDHNVESRMNNKSDPKRVAAVLSDGRELVDLALDAHPDALLSAQVSKDSRMHVETTRGASLHHSGGTLFFKPFGGRTVVNDRNAQTATFVSGIPVCDAGDVETGLQQDISARVRSGVINAAQSVQQLLAVGHRAQGGLASVVHAGSAALTFVVNVVDSLTAKPGEKAASEWLEGSRDRAAVSATADSAIFASGGQPPARSAAAFVKSAGVAAILGRGNFSLLGACKTEEQKRHATARAMSDKRIEDHLVKASTGALGVLSKRDTEIVRVALAFLAAMRAQPNLPTLFTTATARASGVPDDFVEPEDDDDGSGEDEGDSDICDGDLNILAGVPVDFGAGAGAGGGAMGEGIEPVLKETRLAAPPKTAAKRDRDASSDAAPAATPAEASREAKRPLQTAAKNQTRTTAAQLAASAEARPQQPVKGGDIRSYFSAKPAAASAALASSAASNSSESRRNAQ